MVKYNGNSKTNDTDIKIQAPKLNIDGHMEDMLDKYYGNKNKEKAYNQALKRFNSNKNPDGTINNYGFMDKDIKLLQLEDYQKKAEKIKRYNNGDHSVYNSQDELEADKEYIRTNNYAYDRVATTEKNLATLGKYGEKYPLVQFSRNNGRSFLTNTLINTGKLIVNTAITVRNVGAVVYRGIGRPVSRLYAAIAKNGNKGVYANKPMHRYEARKDYFEQEELKRLAIAGKKPNILTYPLKIRFQAVFQAKKGNAAVLEAKRQEIKKSVVKKAKNDYFAEYLKQVNQRIIDLENEKNSILSAKPINYQRVSEIENAQNELGRRRHNILTNPNLQDVVKNNSIDEKANSIIQTDAISLEQHDKANKGNVTRTVTIAKAATIAGVKFAGPKLKEWMLEHSKIPNQVSKENIGISFGTKKIEGKELNYEIPSNGSVMPTEEQLLDKFSIKNLMNKSDENGFSYAYNNTGTTGTRDNLDFFRGAAQEINGRTVSISDGNGFDISGITTGSIPQELLNNGNISDNANLFDILAALQRQAGNNVTAKDLIDKVMKCPSVEEQSKLIEEMSKGLDFWKSTSSTGIANGWDNARDEIANVLNDIGTSTIKPEMSTGTIKFPDIAIPNLSASSSKEFVTEYINNPRIVKALGIGEDIANGMSIYDAIDMFFENIRRTKSNEKNNLGEYSKREYDPKPDTKKANFTGAGIKEDKKKSLDKFKDDHDEIIDEIEQIEEDIER